MAGSPVKLGMTGGVDPASPLCHSRENGNPVRTGSPIRSASLSVEDDKKECGSPIRSASLSVEDDTGSSRLRMTGGGGIPAFFLSFP